MARFVPGGGVRGTPARQHHSFLQERLLSWIVFAGFPLRGEASKVSTRRRMAGCDRLVGREPVA
jgi:hypothetical protein